MKQKFAVLTSNRADYGLLRHLMQRLEKDPSVELTVLVTGSHLKRSLGNTVDEICSDQYERIHCLDLIIGNGKPEDLASQCSRLLISFAPLFKEQDFKAMIVLGDRYEVLCASFCASLFKIPIVHIHGGDETLGAIDNQFRHAISKLAHLHFPVTDLSASRILQMGEDPGSVFVIGSPFLDRMREIEKIEFSEFSHRVRLKLKKPFALCTIHPETNSCLDAKELCKLCIGSVLHSSEYNLLITKSNTDAHGREINLLIEKYAHENCERTQIVSSLGFELYMQAMLHCEFLIGNSSSGIMEAPLLGKFAINVGARQEGRESSWPTIHTASSQSKVLKALNSIESVQKVSSSENPYYQSESPAKKIHEVLLSWQVKSESLYKPFHWRDS